MYVFEELLEGSKVPLLRVSVRAKDDLEEKVSFEGVVYFMEEGTGLKESHRFIYDGGEGEFLIPLTSSPYWSYSDKLQTLMLDFIGSGLLDRELEITVTFERLRLFSEV